jgi:O-antigen/teichoic acid export membrane protein
MKSYLSHKRDEEEEGSDMKKALTYWRTHEKLELILNRAISLVLPFLLVPILLHKIDLKTYGLFILISGFASVISFTDFGISNILVREISAILEDRKDSELSNVISNSLRILICSAFFIIFTGALVAGLTNWEVFLKISPEEVLQFKSAVVLASLSIGLSMIGSAAGKILLGLGLNRQHSRFLLVSNFTTAIGIIISAQFPHPLSPMVLAQLGIPALIGILKLIFMMREKPTL